MVQYRVSFFYNLCNSNGMLFKCVQRAVTVSRAKNAEAASEKAKREFERLEKIPNWKCRAQFLEVETVEMMGAYAGIVTPHISNLLWRHKEAGNGFEGVLQELRDEYVEARRIDP
jgi:hypothetical protein